MSHPIFLLRLAGAERIDDERRGDERRLHGHGHPVSGERIDDARGVADHEDAVDDGGAAAEDDRLRGEEAVLRRLVPCVHLLEPRLLGADGIDEGVPPPSEVRDARGVNQSADVGQAAFDRRHAEIAAAE